MKKYPPFCIHFYKEKYTDFPIWSPNFNSEKDALHYAATHYLDCRLVRLGYWSAKKNPERYFILENVDSQVMLF